MGRSLMAMVVAGMLLVLSACGSAEQVSEAPAAQDFGTVRIGTGFSEETEMVAYLWARALEQAGYRTEVEDTGDTRQAALDALQRKKDPVMVVPDYSGSLLLHLTSDGRVSPQARDSRRQGAEHEPSSGPSSPGLNVNGLSSADILDTLPSLLPEGLDTLEASSAENKDALVVTKATAARYGLSTISDLAEHCAEMTFGVPEGFPDRAYGTEGLRHLYGCTPGRYVQESDRDQLVGKLIREEVDVADLSTNVSAIHVHNLTVLEDPKANFIAQQILPVVHEEELPASAAEAINQVSRDLDTENLRFLNRLMSGRNPVSAQEAAQFWLKDGRG